MIPSCRLCLFCVDGTVYLLRDLLHVVDLSGAKSFLERFGEKCQERAHQGTPTGTGGTPAKNLSVTPNTRLVQDKLRAAQAASTTTSELTQRQKLVNTLS